MRTCKRTRWKTKTPALQLGQRFETTRRRYTKRTTTSRISIRTLPMKKRNGGIHPNEEEKYIQNEEVYPERRREVHPGEEAAGAVRQDGRNTYIADPAEILKNQQHNLQMLQQYHRITENQNFFNDNHIKQEIEMKGEDLGYDGQKELLHPQDQVELFGGQRLVGDHRLVAQQPKTDYYETQIKTEPDLIYFMPYQHILKKMQIVTSTRVSGVQNYPAGATNHHT
ncbi:hypothetical protein EVAR_99173_1 [Eumeta japonica]|uniref:Uncharacterized protein n=1 Tax=Eumeta variegata TaxID=151549 RepID=A0A4C1T8G4_EUMVA|nr:hypothetical protein EVAR_99173_1 [Eumeta japonica]